MTDQDRVEVLRELRRRAYNPEASYQARKIAASQPPINPEEFRRRHEAFVNERPWLQYLGNHGEEVEETCANCKHWIKQLGKDEGACTLGSSDNGLPDNEASLAWGLDGDLYAATMHTKAEFSCNQWEEKPESV